MALRLHSMKNNSAGATSEGANIFIHAASFHTMLLFLCYTLSLVITARLAM